MEIRMGVNLVKFAFKDLHGVKMRFKFFFFWWHRMNIMEKNENVKKSNACFYEHYIFWNIRHHIMSCKTSCKYIFLKRLGFEVHGNFTLCFIMCNAKEGVKHSWNARSYWVSTLCKAFYFGNVLNLGPLYYT